MLEKHHINIAKPSSINEAHSFRELALSSMIHECSQNLEKGKEIGGEQATCLVDNQYP